MPLLNLFPFVSEKKARCTSFGGMVCNMHLLQKTHLMEIKPTDSSFLFIFFTLCDAGEYGADVDEAKLARYGDFCI
jgi:hypothetical protein